MSSNPNPTRSRTSVLRQLSDLSSKLDYLATVEKQITKGEAIVGCVMVNVPTAREYPTTHQIPVSAELILSELRKQIAETEKEFENLLLNMPPLTRGFV